MKIVPLGDKVVVKRLDAAETTEGGIVLPDAAREQPTQGRIVSVGNGRIIGNGSLVELQVSDGDRVLFSSYAGVDVTVDGEELLILGESDILAVFS